MTEPHPSHLDGHDPAKTDVRDVRDEADREMEAYGPEAQEIVFLMPEDSWAEFLRLTGGADEGGETRYRGALFRKAAVTAVVAQEGF